MEEYQIGKEIIEQNYGTKHQMYMEFVNAINGAKLRTKYIQNSNLPEPENRYDQRQNQTDLNIIPSYASNNNIFVRE